MGDNKNSRIVEIDLLKGLMIVAMIFFHVIMWRESVLIGFEALFGGFLLIFFVAAGYTYTPGNKSYVKSVISKAKRLLLPLFFYLTGIFLFLAVFLVIKNHGTTIGQLVKIYLRCIQTFCSGTTSYDSSMKIYMYFYMLTMAGWYLRAIFIAYLFFMPLAKIVDKSTTWTWIIIITLLSTTATHDYVSTERLYSNAQDIPAFVAIMLIGCFLKRKDVISKLKAPGKLNYLVYAACFIVSGFLYKLCGGSTGLMGGDWGNAPGINVYSSMIMALLQFYAWYNILTVFPKTKIMRNGLCFVGINSIHYLMTNLIFGGIPKYLIFGETINGANNSWLVVNESILLFLVTVLLCSLWALCIKKVSHVFNKRNNNL